MITQSSAAILDGASRLKAPGAGRTRPRGYGLAVLAMLCASGAVLAQTAAAPPPHRWHRGYHAMVPRTEQRRMERLTLLLDLTPAQQQKVQTILAAEHARMRQSMEQAMRQIRETHRAVHQDAIEKLGAVLTPTQMKKFEALMPGPGMMNGMMMHGMMMHGMDMGPPPAAGPGPGPR